MKVIVKQDAEKPVPVEVLAESIKAISEGVRKLRAGPLNDKALLLLIHHASPGGYRTPRPSMHDIRAVLDGMDALEATYLKKRPKP